MSRLMGRKGMLNDQYLEPQADRGSDNKFETSPQVESSVAEETSWVWLHS